MALSSQKIDGAKFYNRGGFFRFCVAAFEVDCTTCADKIEGWFSADAICRRKYDFVAATSARVRLFHMATHRHLIRSC